MWNTSFESEGRGYLNLYSPYAPRPAPPFLYKMEEGGYRRIAVTEMETK